MVRGENLSSNLPSGEGPASLQATVRPRRRIQIPTVAEFGNDADATDAKEDAFFLSAAAGGRMREGGRRGGGLDEREGKKQRARD